MNILIVKLSPFHELFNAVPTVHLLKEYYNAKISWVVHEYYNDLVKLFDDVDNIILYPENELKHSNRKKFRIDLHQFYYDLVIDLEGSMESALICKSSRKNLKTRIFGPSFQREGAFKLYDVICGNRNIDRPNYIQCMDVLKYLKIPCNNVQYSLDSSNFKHPVNNDSYILICTESKHAKKNLPIEVCKKIISKSNEKVLIISNKNNSFRYDELECTYSDNKVEVLEKKISIFKKIELIYYSKKMICCNYDDLQIASALGLDGLMINIENKSNYSSTCNKILEIISLDTAKKIDFVY